MTDYHTVIAQAVESLDQNTSRTRRVLYERARTAQVILQVIALRITITATLRVASCDISEGRTHSLRLRRSA
jgi:hypothetical protein